MIAWWLIAPLMGPSGAARADDVLTRSANHAGAKIIGYRGGQLSLRTIDGKPLSLWIDEIDLINVDRAGAFSDFNQAERFLAEGRPEQALTRYRRCLRLGEEFWSDVFASRMLIAADRAGAIDTAVGQFIRVLQGDWGGPAAAARLIPQRIPTKPSGKAARAIEQLDAESARAADPAVAALLLLLRYDLRRSSGDARAMEDAARVAELTIPEAARSERASAIVFSALEQVLAESVTAESLSALDRAIRDCPAATLPSFLLMKGDVLSRTASTREDSIRAAYPYLRAAVHFPDDPRAALGYYGAGLMMERVGRAEQAIGLLRAGLERAKSDQSLRVRIEAAILRLQPAGGGRP